ncbi:MAG: NADPH-dependent FMN reductase [Gammaproteobacteria bacterium]
MIKILAFSGSSRKDSVNKKMVKIAAQGAEEAGAEVTYIDLADYPMPIYNGDLEDAEGLPKGAQKFKKILTDHDGVLISTPEYNSSFPALLKNAIDWASRSESADETRLSAYQNKIAAIMCATPGGSGGMKGLMMLRLQLEHIGVIVLPNQQSISQAFNAFDEQGNLIDSKKQIAVKKIGADLVNLVNKINA